MADNRIVEMKKVPLLSICIPTYNRLDVLRNTINSIYRDATPEIYSLFEIIISDNSTEQNCKAVVDEFAKYGNFYYYSTKCEGFLNSFHALSYGKGKFLKLHNNMAMLKKGALSHMIQLIEECIQNKPFLFFTDGYRLNGSIHYHSTFESFMYDASYFTSWSSGFGIWKDDFERVKSVPLNKFFPQTSLLVTQSYKEEYWVDDVNLFITQDVPQKGGYNIFKAFSVDYLNIIKDVMEQGTISEKCYGYIKESLLFKFLSVRYFKTVIAKMDKFDYSDVDKNLKINYSRPDYVLFKISSLWGPFRFLLREFYRKHFTGLKKQV